MGDFDLFHDRDRHSRAIEFPWHRAGGRNAYDARLTHRSDIEEDGFVFALQADVETVDRHVVTDRPAWRSGCAAVFPFDQVQDRIGGVGLGLVLEIHPGVEPDVDPARDDPEVQMRRLNADVPTLGLSRLDGLERPIRRCRNR
jgi:hypothetical protein